MPLLRIRPLVLSNVAMTSGSISMTPPAALSMSAVMLRCLLAVGNPPWRLMAALLVMVPLARLRSAPKLPLDVRFTWPAFVNPFVNERAPVMPGRPSMVRLLAASKMTVFATRAPPTTTAWPLISASSVAVGNESVVQLIAVFHC